MNISKEKLIVFTSEFYNTIGISGSQWSAKSVHYGDFIPNKKLKNAQKNYANYDINDEKPLILIDDTVMRSSKRGLLITNENVWFYIYKERRKSELAKGKIPLQDLESVRFINNKMTSDIIINGQQFGNLSQVNKNEVDALNQYFEKICTNELNISESEIKSSIELKIDPKILSKIKEYLIEGERIIYVAWGLDSLTARDFAVCTTNRILIINRELFGLSENIRDFEYDIITSIGVSKEGTGFLDTVLNQCKLEIHAAGSIFSIDTLSREEAETIIKISRNQKNEKSKISQNAVVKSSPQIDIVDEIKKLKGLFDIGAISESEFSGAKAKLLEKI